MPKEQCYGVIVVYTGEEENLFLILNQTEGSWSFPKGHTEEGELPKETALRELNEEAGITEIDFLDAPLVHEEYLIENNSVLKCNDYFIGFVKDKNVVLQESEVVDHKWVNFYEAIATIQYPQRKEVLKKAKEYLDLIK